MTPPSTELRDAIDRVAGYLDAFKPEPGAATIDVVTGERGRWVLDAADLRALVDAARHLQTLTGQPAPPVGQHPADLRINEAEATRLAEQARAAIAAIANASDPYA